MSLVPGTRLGPYEIQSAIGSGGMGEVYRARDTKLGREVAIKVLPATLTSDPERLARFQREAQVLAALNHPNIAAIHHVEETTAGPALVMELVEGETLSDRLARGAVPVDEALPIAKQIAEALEAAHEQGIIHRDLKPANIRVRPDGSVKVLDFGLAKLTESNTVTPGVQAAPSLSPTVISPALMTAVGVLLGTAAYMAPEQARGKVVDKRVDIWAFGCVLFEMLSGRRAFGGDDVSDTVAAVLRGEPDWHALPAGTPPQLVRLLRRCITKDARNRLRDAGDLLWELNESRTGQPDARESTEALHRARRRERLALALALTSGLVAIAGAVMMWRSMVSGTPSDVITFKIPPPSNTTLVGVPGGGTGIAPQLAVSPDGRYVVFVAASKGAFRLWLRPLASLEARELSATDQAMFPFWSPDSRFIAFFAGGKLKKVPLTGGPPVVLCDSVGGRGGTWNEDDVIVFAPGASGLQRVSAAGGVPAPVTSLDSSRNETGHRWPHFLPDGRHFFYTAVAGPLDTATRASDVKMGTLDSKDVVSLFAAESAVSYSSGLLFFWRDGTLMAEPFDAEARRITGDPFPVAEQVIAEGLRYVAASVSHTGVLVYASRTLDPVTQLTWRDRSGRVLATVGESAQYSNIALAPDERRVAVSLPTGSVGSTGRPGATADIWVINLDRSTRTRITFGSGSNVWPVWSPIGDRIAFFSSRQNGAIYQVPVNGGGQEEVLLRTTGATIPTDWSRDGRFLAFTNPNGGTNGNDVMIMPLTGDRKPVSFVTAPFTQYEAVFAPDGRWIAYVSVDAAAGEQIFVQPFPATGAQYQVSRNGGTQPMWRGDGRELYFLTPNGQMMAVAVDTGNQFEVANPQQLFDAGLTPGTGGNRQYAVSKDGERFLINASVGGPNQTSLTVVTNWRSATTR